MKLAVISVALIYFASFQSKLERCSIWLPYLAFTFVPHSQLLKHSHRLSGVFIDIKLNQNEKSFQSSINFPSETSTSPTRWNEGF